MLVDNGLHSSNLEWMFQNNQVADEDLLKVLTSEFYSAIYTLALALKREPEKARDAAKQTLLAAVSDRHRYWGQQSLKVWLYSLTVNISQRSNQRSRGDEPGKAKPAPEQSPYTRLEMLQPSPEQDETSLQFENWLAELKGMDVVLLVLRYNLGLVAEEIGQVLRLKTTQVHKSLHAIREQAARRIASGAGENLNSGAHSSRSPLHSQIHAAMDQIPPAEIRRSINRLTQEICYSSTGRDDMDSPVEPAGRNRQQDCHQVVHSEAAIEIQLTSWLRARAPIRVLSEEESARIVAEMERPTAPEPIKRRYLVLLRDLGAIGIAILIVLQIIRLQDSPSEDTQPALAAVATPETDRTGVPLLSPLSGGYAGSLSKPGDLLAWQISGYSLPVESSLDFFPLSLESLPPESGSVHSSYQANLLVAIHYWGEQIHQKDSLCQGRPDYTNLPGDWGSPVPNNSCIKIIMRVYGDLDVLKQFIAAGYPVLIEKTYIGGDGANYYGRYDLVTGYDDSQQRLDLVYTSASFRSYTMTSLPYDQVLREWSKFDNLFIVVYPSGLQKNVIDALSRQDSQSKRLLEHYYENDPHP